LSFSAIRARDHKIVRRRQPERGRHLLTIMERGAGSAQGQGNGPTWLPMREDAVALDLGLHPLAVRADRSVNIA
jgi:hypothetical protein